jgi:8-oxo-dGTP pyrophosphatase MutT (NUDIX family)
VESGLTVRAAGGVVWRRDSSGALEVLVVHRPRYDDWALPKGKLLPGERDEEAAVREVEEETGVRCELGGELPSSTYHDQQGRPKVVRFWAMRPLGGDFRPHDEVDEARWLPLTEAPDALSYAGDRAALAALADALG